MSSRRLIWVLPVAAVLLCAATVWESNQSGGRQVSNRPVAAGGLRAVAPDLQFELYDSKNRTVRLARYLGRHRIDLVFLANGVSVADEPIVDRLLQKPVGNAASDLDILLIVVQQLPQTIRNDLAKRDDPDGSTLLALSDLGGRRGQLPGEAARAWGVLTAEGQVERTSWFTIDRAGRVRWAKANPVTESAGVVEEN